MDPFILSCLRWDFETMTVEVMEEVWLPLEVKAVKQMEKGGQDDDYCAYLFPQGCIR